MNRVFGLIVCVSVMTLMAPAQYSVVVPAALENVQGNGITSNVFNLSATTRARVQFMYDSSLFPQHPITILDMSFRPRTPTFSGPGGSWNDVTIVLGTIPDLDNASTDFNANVNGATTVRTGAFSTGPIVASAGPTGNWIPLGLTAPFVYDPCSGQDLVVEIRRCEGTGMLGDSNDAMATGFNGRRLLHTAGTTSANYPTACTGMSANGSLTSVGAASFALVLKLDLAGSPPPPPWETNDMFADLNVDGAQNPGGQGPIDVFECVNGTALVNINSVLVGNGWEFAVTTAPGLAGPGNCGPGNGGLVSPGGQVLNIDFSAPDLLFVNNLTFPPFPGNLTLPVTSSVPIPNVSGQVGILDGTIPDGIHLSALNQLHFAATTTLAAPVTGPAGDDSTVTVPVGCFSFYDVGYTEIHVASNGRITFGTPDTTAAPTVITNFLFEPPMVGQWADFDPSMGGSITISSPSSNIFRVDYVGVPYFGESTSITSTYSIVLDANASSVIIDGITGIAPHPAATPNTGDLGMLGISPGAAVATDPGVTPFSVGGPFLPASGTDAIYNHGLSGTLGGGVNTLVFVPLATGGYSWTGM